MDSSCGIVMVAVIVSANYRKTPKNSDTRKFVVITLKVEQCGIMRPKDAEGIAKSVDPDQTVPSSMIWVCTVCPGLSVRKLRIISGSFITNNFNACDILNTFLNFRIKIKIEVSVLI